MEPHGQQLWLSFEGSTEQYNSHPYEELL